MHAHRSDVGTSSIDAASLREASGVPLLKVHATTSRAVVRAVKVTHPRGARRAHHFHAFARVRLGKIVPHIDATFRGAINVKHIPTFRRSERPHDDQHLGAR